MTTPLIRPATDADVSELVQLVTRAYRAKDGGAGWTTESHLLDGQRTNDEEVRSAISHPDAVLLVAQIDETIIGCIRVDRVDADGAHFGLFAVDPRAQSNGTGGTLLSAAEELARSDWNRRWMELEVLHQRQDLQAWYHRRGYQPTGATCPFPYTEERFGLPRVDDLYFDVLRRVLTD